MHWLIWLGAALLFALVEILSLTFVLLMFAGGAIAAAVASACGLGLGWQIGIFAAVSTLLLLLIRPWLLVHLRRRVPLVETNASAHVGRTAVVVDPVSEMDGRVKLVGEVWSARTENGAPRLPMGAEVQVLRIDGATAVVQAIPTPHQSLSDAAQA